MGRRGDAALWGLRRAALGDQLGAALHSGQLPAAGPKADWSPCTDPAHLLCRALRMAPVSYRQFAIAALQPDARLRIEAAVHRTWEDRALQKDRRGTTKSFRSVGQLAAEMQQFAAAERLTVQLSAYQRDIIIRRADAPSMTP